MSASQLSDLSARQRHRAAEVRRLVRLLQIVQAVATEPLRWQRADLAAQHGVSERTITKDLAVLRAAGLPVANDGGYNPGYYMATEIDAGLLAIAGTAHLEIDA